MLKFRAHHIRDLYFLLDKIDSSMRWGRFTNLNESIDAIVDKEFTGRADYYLKVVQNKNKEYEVDWESAVDYIGPNGENYDRFILTYTTFFKQVITAIHFNPEIIIQIQTDPSDVCVGCWLAELRRFGKHCLQDPGTPDNEKNKYFPLEDIDVVIVNSLAEKSGKQVLSSPGIVEGLENLNFSLTACELKELFFEDKNEISSELIRYLARTLREYYKTVGLQDNFSEIYYAYNVMA